jgi:CHASE2 domain-containing sensor protein
MDKLAILKLKGDFQSGFQAILEIWKDGEQSLSDRELELTAFLPPNPELAALVQHHWQDKYRSLGVPSRWIARVQPIGIVYDGSIELMEHCVKECQESARDLSDRLNAWLDEREFRPIERKLSDLVPLGTGLRVLVRTEDELLPKLPWHLWDCIAQRQAEVAFSPHDFQTPKLPPKSGSAIVRILAILGHSKGIDVEADQQLLQNLPGADVTFLVEPSRKTINDLLWDQAWDILFFAGHSETEGQTGRIYLNPTDSLTLGELGYGLQRAVDRGLKVAIFNSCDGLGLARQLNALNVPLPQIVVMRELVPDLVAQAFLKHFLTAFSSGQSFYRSVKQARERLQELEDKFPCATWLPTIVQHPAVFPFKWDDFLPSPAPAVPSSTPPRSPQPLWQRWLCWSFAIACLVITGRSFGLLQAWELKTLDALMRLRPEEPPDPRIAIVTVTEADIQAQDTAERRGSLSDTALTQALQKLKQHQPRVIALDIYRPFAVQPNQKWLAEQLKSPTSPIFVCSVEGGLDKPGIPPPPNAPRSRVGFSDMSIDPDGIIRRQLFGMSPGKICNTDKSFSFQVAQTYLSAEGIEFKRTSPQSYQIGTVNFPRVAHNTGGYNNIDAAGYQVLLNYRSAQAPAQTLTLGDLLGDRFDPEWIRDRIVLIGTTARSIEDGLLTPYSAKYSPIEHISGVFIQAQMVSQILSAVKDNRPLLQALPDWGEAICIGLGAIVGELLFFGVFYRRKIPIFLYLGIGCIVLLGLVGIGFVLLLFEGIWLPIVPMGCAFALSGMRNCGDVVAYRDGK